MKKTDWSHFPLGRRLFLSQPVYVRVDGEGLIKQCLYILCMFLCSRKSSNVFSCWIQRRDCPGKSELLWKGSRAVKSFVPDLHLVKLRAEFLSPGELSGSGGSSLKQFIFKECAHMQAHTKSMKSREETGKKPNVTKKRLH